MRELQANYLSITADLVDEADDIAMESNYQIPLHLFSQPSPHGAIGQPARSNFETQSYVLPQSPSIAHSRSPYLNGEIDIAAIIAQAHKDHESHVSLMRDKERPVREDDTSSASKDKPIGASIWATHPHGGFDMNGAATDGISKSDESWDRATLASLPRSPPKRPLPLDARSSTFTAYSAPHSAPLYNVFNPNASPPTGVTKPNGRDRDPVASAGHQVEQHLQSLSKLLVPLVAQGQELEGIRQETAVWKQEWAKANKEAAQLRSMVTSLQAKDKNSATTGPLFTACLIDGDGLIFRDEYLKQGHQGGQLAAQTLLSALPRLIAEAEASPKLKGAEVTVKANVNDSADQADIVQKELGSVVVHVFLNKSGLGTVLTKSGCVPSWGVYESFWQGFSAAHNLFTVIDVGPGKEASDSKIREYLKLYTRNNQCANIILGATHDNGYANELSALQTESRLSKLLLLKGYADLAPQLRQYSSRVVSIPDLFRTTKIPASQPQSFSAVVSSATKSMTGTKGTKKQTAANTAIPMSIAASSVADSPSEADSASLAGDLAQLQIELESIVEGAIDEVQVFEWNQLVSGTGNKASGVKGKKGKVNQEDEWIEANAKNKKKDKVKKDKTVKAGGDDEWDTIKGDSGKKKNGKKNAGGKTVRGLDPRPCHAYYLGPVGCTNKKCYYSHDYELDDDQLDELAILTKQMPCPFVRFNKCRFGEEECIYGHQCPRGKECSFEKCRFDEIDPDHRA